MRPPWAWQQRKKNNMIRIFLFLMFVIFLCEIQAQELPSEKPKLVVGIVVDQMRYDYLTRFWERYGEDGFRRMVDEGFNFKNNHFNYVPTYTGPGHASIHTGTTPMNHGIVANHWYDKFIDELVYCVQDDSVQAVGTDSNAGKMSPHRMKSTTVADQNRLHTQMRGKTIGVALKDRGSILPAGHTANAAYWFLGKGEGKWITSSFYMNELPKWVQDFNNSGVAESYLKTWNTLYDINTYIASGGDDTDFERGFHGQDNPTFPYDLKALAAGNKGYDLIMNVAYGNDLTTDFALAAIEGEALGMDEYTDFLTLSYSSTDYVGHNFGVNSKEVEDTYLRLDANIAIILQKLDKTVGKGNYTVFLTADHGAVDVPAYLQSNKIPAGYFDSAKLNKELEEFVLNKFNKEGLLKNIFINQLYFNYEILEEVNITSAELQRSIADYLFQKKHIYNVYTREQLLNKDFSKGMAALVQNGYNQKRSGDVIYILDPAIIASTSRTGTSHGSGFSYDTHSPLLFYGNGIKPGSTFRRSEIVDIAPTIAALLGIEFPNAVTGNPLYIMLDK